MPARPVGDPSAGVFRIDGIGVVDVAEDRLAPAWIIGSMLGNAVSDGTRISSPGLSAGLCLGKVQQMNRGSPGAGEHDVLHAEVRGQLLLKGLGFRPQDVVAAFNDLQDPPIDCLTLIHQGERDFFDKVCHDFLNYSALQTCRVYFATGVNITALDVHSALFGLSTALTRSEPIPLQTCTRPSGAGR